MTERIIFILFIGFLTATILFSHREPGGFYFLLKLLEFSFVAYYVAAVIRSKTQVLQMAVLLSVGVICESALAVLQYFNQGSLGGFLYFFGERTFLSQTPGIANASLSGDLVLRAYGTFSHPNVLAGYLVISLTLIVFSLSSVVSFRKKLLFLLALTIGTLGLFVTFSRLAIALWLLCIIAAFCSRVIVSQKHNRKLLLAGLVVLFIIGSSLFTPLFHRFSQTAAGEESFVQRELLIDAAARMISDKPLAGVGLGNFLPTLAVIDKPLSLGMYLQPVHNIFLLIAAEIGIIGFAFFIWFLFKTYERLRGSPLRRTFALMLSAILILGFFDHYFLTLQQGQLLFAVVVGLCWSRIKT